MPEGTEDLRQEVLRLRQVVDGLAGRLAHVEGLLGQTATQRSAATAREAPTPSARPAGVADEGLPENLVEILRWIPLTGRLLLVLAGAYMLRAMTDGGQLSVGLGAALGLAYAGVWLVLAARAGRLGRRVSATFHALGSSLVAFPLLVETTARFGLFSPTAAALALGVVLLAGLGVAVRHDLRGVAWIFTVGAVLASVGVLGRVGGALPFSVLFLGAGLATLLAGRVRAWDVLPWVGALAADIGVLHLTGAAQEAGSSIAPAAALAVHLALVVLYMGHISRDGLHRPHALALFDAVQSLLVLLIGMRGALLVAEGMGAVGEVLGVASLLAAAGAYLLGFKIVSRERRGWFFYYATVGLVLALLGSAVLLSRPSVPWAVAAVAAALLGRWSGRVTLNLHGLVLAAAAAGASGLAELVLRAWWVPADMTWGAFNAREAVVLAAAAVVAALPISTENPYWRRRALGLRALAILLLVILGGGVVLVLAGPPLVGTPGVDADAGALAALRTGLLALGALACAVLAWRTGSRPAAWIVYLLLALTPAKLLFEDLRVGRTATLWVSFLLYGLALSIAPGLARRRRAAAADEPAPAAPADPAKGAATASDEAPAPSA